MKKLFESNKKNNTLIWLFLSCFFILIYSGLYWNKTIPFTDGWGIYYSELIKSGKYPYKDFYVYLPPLNLIIDSILWKFSLGYMIIYRLFRVLERILLLTLLYFILTKVVNPKVSSVASFIGVVYCSATNFDLLGDYNQTVNVLLVLICITLFTYIRNIENEKKRYLFLLGILIGVSFLLKQTIFVASVIIIFFYLSIVYYIDKRKNYFKDIFITFLGFVVPVLIAIAILACNGAFFDFINQVFLDTGAKGSLFTTLASMFITLFKPGLIIISLCFGVICFNEKNKIQRFLAIVILGISIYIMYSDKIVSFSKVIDDRNVLFFFFDVLIFTIIFGITNYKKAKNIAIVEILIGGILIVKWISIIYHNPAIAQFVNDNIFIFSFMGDICTVLACIGIVLFVFEFKQYILTKEKKHIEWSTLFICGLIAAYYASMTCVDYIAAWGVFLLVSVEIAYFLAKNTRWSFLTNSLVFFCITICIMGCSSRKIANAYQWWGWSDSVCETNSLKNIDIKALKGFKVNENVKELYETIYNVVDKNTDDTDIIYSFPHVKIFNILAENTNLDVFAPIPFYDVCADDYAKADADRLKQNPPDVVIWCDMPGCMETHEAIFRNGERLGQRDIAKWFNGEVEKNKYDLIGQYDNIFVYKIVDGEKIDYIDIQDVNRENQSLKMDAK